MCYQPTRDLRREAVREPWGLTREWWAAYNRRDNGAKRALSHFPLVTFGGAELGATALRERVFEEPSALTARGRDPGWSHSVVDRWAVHQPSPRKAHVLLDFRRCRANGAPYGVGHSRLTVFTKEGGEWGARVLSSCGLRHPEDVDSLTDEARETAVREAVDALRRAAAAGDEAALRARCHVPFVRLDGPTLDVANEPEEIDFDVAEGVGSVVACEVLPPQSADKVLVDLTLGGDGSAGTERGGDGNAGTERGGDGNGTGEPAGGLYLLTEKGGEWGLQMSSTRAGVGGLA